MTVYAAQKCRKTVKKAQNRPQQSRLSHREWLCEVPKVEMRPMVSAKQDRVLAYIYHSIGPGVRKDGGRARIGETENSKRVGWHWIIKK